MIHNSLLVLLPSVLLAVSGCAAPGPCGDESDNDGDGLVDYDDHGCSLSGGESEGDGMEPPCSDGLDNDGDGLIDSGDPGCDSPADQDEYNAPLSACNDGIDNDGDGLIDFPYDPGCALTLEDDETDTCPAQCPACGNGVDDDGDGIADYPDDPGCDSAADTSELDITPTACGPSVPLDMIAPDGTATGKFTGMENNELISPTCAGSGPEAAFLLTLGEASAVRIATEFPETTIDTVVYVRTDCRKPGTEIACNDDGATPAADLFVDSLEPGDYYIVLDSHIGVAAGDFKLQVQLYDVAGEECDPEASNCAPGLVCRLNEADSKWTCEHARCADGVDNDDDGATDFPDDPGCESDEDDDELDTCPGGVDCPACGNGDDDDLDMLTDYPDDPDCTSASDDTEAPPGPSCAGNCGGFDPSGCACDDACESFGDCCPDKIAVCGSGSSCVGNCGGFAASCACDASCASFGDCCPDKVAVCGP